MFGYLFRLQCSAHLAYSGIFVFVHIIIINRCDNTWFTITYILTGSGIAISSIGIISRSSLSELTNFSFLENLELKARNIS